MPQARREDIGGNPTELAIDSVRLAREGVQMDTLEERERSWWA
jgi:hypothetical protein